VRAKELPALLTPIAGNWLGVPLGLEVALLDEELACSSALGVWAGLGLGKHALSPNSNRSYIPEVYQQSIDRLLTDTSFEAISPFLGLLRLSP